MPKGATFRVPRLYKAAAKVISVVSEENGNLEQLVQQYNGKTNTKALAALVSKTLDNEGLLDTIIQNSEILVKEANANPWLFRILITELLLGKQRLPIGSKPVQTVLAYGPTLRTEFLRATGKLHKKQKRFKSEPGVREADPECKQDSSTHNQTRVFGERYDKKQELNSMLHSKSLCIGAQDYIKLEENENIQSKSEHVKQPKNKQRKQDLALEQVPNDEQISGLKIRKRKHNMRTGGSTQKKHKVKSPIRVHKPGIREANAECKQESSTHNQTRVFGESYDKKQELNSTLHSKSLCIGAQDYIKLEENENIQSKSEHVKQPKDKQGKQDLALEQVPNDEQISGLKIRKRKHNMRTGGSTQKKHKVKSPIRVHKTQYFE